MRTAARIAHTFNLDPVAVLDEEDNFKWAVRVAAHNVIGQDYDEAKKKNRK